MINYNKNKLINETLDKYYDSFSHTLDTADYVPERFNKKICKYIFKNMKKAFRKIDKEDRKFQRVFNKKNKTLEMEKKKQQNILQREQQKQNKIKDKKVGENKINADSNIS